MKPRKQSSQSPFKDMAGKVIGYIPGPTQYFDAENRKITEIEYFYLLRLYLESTTKETISVRPKSHIRHPLYLEG
jgi:hypothetical protein